MREDATRGYKCPKCIMTPSLGGDNIVAPKLAPQSLTRKKNWLPNRTRHKMVLGDDLGLDEAVSLALNDLVGWFSYRSRCSTPISMWVKMHWIPILGYELDIFFLLRG